MVGAYPQKVLLGARHNVYRTSRRVGVYFEMAICDMHACSASSQALA